MADDVLQITRLSRKARPKPTPEYVQGLAETLRTHFLAQDEQVEQTRRVREQTETIPGPSWLPHISGMEMNDAAVGDEIKRIVSSVNSRPFRLEVIPADPEADEQQKNGTLRERFSEQALIEAGRNGTGVSTYEQEIDACFGDGASWSRFIYDKHRWEAVWDVPDTMDYWQDAQTGEEAKDDADATNLVRGKKPKPADKYLADREDAKKGAGVPFKDTSIDVNTIFPLWRGDDLVAVLIAVERPVIELQEAYGVSPPGDVANEIFGPGVSQQESWQYGRTARFLEYWDSTHVTYFVQWGQGTGRNFISKPGEMEQLRTIKHGYGQVPFFFAPGFMFNYWRGRKVGWGIAQDWVKLARYRQFLWNLIVDIAARSAGAPMAHFRPATGEPLIVDPNLPKGNIEDIVMNGVYEGQPGEKFEMVPLPGVPDAVKDLLAIVNTMIEKLQTPRVNAIGTDMSGAGFAYAQIFAEIKVSYDVYVKHLEAMIEAKTRFMWKLIRNVVQEKVYVHYSPPNPKSNRGKAEWLAAGPDDLTDAVGLRCHINADPPTAEIVMARLVGERLQQKTLNMDRAIEMLGDNPEEIRRGQIIDSIRNEPEYRQLLKEQTLQELDRGDLLRKAAVMAAQSGMLPGLDPAMAAQVMQQRIQGGIPGGPGSPTGPTGLPGQMNIPDMAALGATPNGAGVATTNNPYAGAGGPPGPTPMAAQAQLPPTAGMQAGVQRLR